MVRESENEKITVKLSQNHTESVHENEKPTECPFLNKIPNPKSTEKNTLGNVSMLIANVSVHENILNKCESIKPYLAEQNV